MPQHASFALPQSAKASHASSTQSAQSLRERLESLTQDRMALDQEAQELVAHWRSSFPQQHLPFYLARLGGESLTLLRWRRTAQTPGAGGRRFELLGSGETALREQPAAVQQVVFEFERLRISINHNYAMSCYEQSRLSDLLRQRRDLATARKRLAG